MLVPLAVLAIVMGVASPFFTRRIEPSVDALVRSVRQRVPPTTLVAQSVHPGGSAGRAVRP